MSEVQPIMSAKEIYTELAPLIDLARESRTALQELGAMPGALVRAATPANQNLHVLDATLSPCQSIKANSAANAVYQAMSSGESFDTLVVSGDGNWSRAVAFAGAQVSVHCIAYVPETIIDEKEQALHDLGADVQKMPDLISATQAAQYYGTKTEGAFFVDPHHNPHASAGQALVFDDIKAGLTNAGIDLRNDPTTLLVQVGHGNLLTGIAVAVNQAFERGEIGENVAVHAVQPEDCRPFLAMSGALHKTGIVTSANNTSNQIYDGLTTTEPSTRSLILGGDKNFVHNAWEVNIVDCAQAANLLYRTLGKCIEPAGLVSTAAYLHASEQPNIPAQNTESPVQQHTRTFVSIASGLSCSQKVYANVLEASQRAQKELLETLPLSPRSKNTERRLRVWNGMQTH